MRPRVRYPVTAILPDGPITRNGARSRRPTGIAENPDRVRDCWKDRQIEQAAAQGPVTLIPLGRGAERIAPWLGGVIERSGVDDCPVEKNHYVDRVRICCCRRCRRR